jgi:hypothetical protein
MLHERSEEILDSFRGIWNNFELFSEYGDSGRSADGGILTRYSLRSLGRRTATMDFQELLSLLHSEGLLSERGGVVDPSKLSVSTVHSVFRVVNLKCYTSWYTTLRAKKTIDTFDGAADKYELGFREYQMVRSHGRTAHGSAHACRTAADVLSKGRQTRSACEPEGRRPARDTPRYLTGGA